MSYVHRHLLMFQYFCQLLRRQLFIFYPIVFVYYFMYIFKTHGTGHLGASVG